MDDSVNICYQLSLITRISIYMQYFLYILICQLKAFMLKPVALTMGHKFSSPKCTLSKHKVCKLNVKK